MNNIHKILHPTDLSETSNAAFLLACALAQDYCSDLLVLHVYPPPVNGAEAIDRNRSQDVEDDLLEALHTLTPVNPSTHVEYRVEEGATAEVILDVSRECELIVMGTHGRGGISRVLMGSVAEHVLREAVCPVVTVRPTAALPMEVADHGIEAHDTFVHAESAFALTPQPSLPAGEGE